MQKGGELGRQQQQHKGQKNGECREGRREQVCADQRGRRGGGSSSASFTLTEAPYHGACTAHTAFVVRSLICCSPGATVAGSNLSLANQRAVERAKLHQQQRKGLGGNFGDLESLGGGGKAGGARKQEEEDGEEEEEEEGASVGRARKEGMRLAPEDAASKQKALISMAFAGEGLGRRGGGGSLLCTDAAHHTLPRELGHMSTLSPSLMLLPSNLLQATMSRPSLRPRRARW